jgi:hypothetical protein
MKQILIGALSVVIMSKVITNDYPCDMLESHDKCYQIKKIGIKT